MNKWFAGQRMDMDPILDEEGYILRDEPTTEYCQTEIRKPFGDNEYHEDWEARNCFNVVWAERTHKEYAYPHKLPARQQLKACRELIDGIGDIREYNEALDIARELGKMSALRMFDYLPWIAIRDYLTTVVLCRFTKDVKGLQNCKLWELKAPRIESAKTQREFDAWLDYQEVCQRIRNVSSDDDYEPVTEDISEPPEPETWRPSRKPVPTRFVFHIDPSEYADLICTSDRPVQSFRMAPEAIEAWMSNWDIE